ncbi:MAG: hypothetical protein GTN53_40495 [Candidatus Aminicenantes bacterium]|nr:hypothetical protein [Candidatus Aminicenantes bacterium]NIQ72775.1 hypothetical protein [Candidatus Aminicenantes bacterium]NIT28796.1 hypothetical protein [Candidatus Aminicenantes bacterium]
MKEKFPACTGSPPGMDEIWPSWTRSAAGGHGNQGSSLIFTSHFLTSDNDTPYSFKNPVGNGKRILETKSLILNIDCSITCDYLFYFGCLASPGIFFWDLVLGAWNFPLRG